MEQVPKEFQHLTNNDDVNVVISPSASFSA
jgi:hypothetical protein